MTYGFLPLCAVFKCCFRLFSFLILWPRILNAERKTGLFYVCLLLFPSFLFFFLNFSCFVWMDFILEQQTEDGNVFTTVLRTFLRLNSLLFRRTMYIVNIACSCDPQNCNLPWWRHTEIICNLHTTSNNFPKKLLKMKPDGWNKRKSS